MHELVCWRTFSVVYAKFSLNAGERGLILPQLNGPGIVDSLLEPLPFGRNGFGGGEVGYEEEWRKSGRENCGWHIKKKLKLKIIIKKELEKNFPKNVLIFRHTIYFKFLTRCM